MSYSKIKQLEHEFERVRIDKEQLKETGVVIENLYAKIKDRIMMERSEYKIEITSKTGEDVFKGNDAGIFDEPDIPARIREVRYLIAGSYDDFYLLLQISARNNKYASLEIKAPDGVIGSGLFQEIKGHMENYEVSGKRVINFINSLLGYMFIFMVVCFVLFLSMGGILFEILQITPNLIRALNVLLVSAMTGYPLAHFVIKILNTRIPKVRFTDPRHGKPEPAIGITGMLTSLFNIFRS